jgi:hypothetical protein
MVNIKISKNSKSKGIGTLPWPLYDEKIFKKYVDAFEALAEYDRTGKLPTLKPNTTATKEKFESALKATRGVVKKARITPKDLEVTITKVRHAHPSKA